MCAGLIADQTLLRNGLLAALGEAPCDAGRFVTPFTVGIAHPFRSVRQMVARLIGPVGRATHRRLSSLIDYTIESPLTGKICLARARHWLSRRSRHYSTAVHLVAPFSGVSAVAPASSHLAWPVR